MDIDNMDMRDYNALGNMAIFCVRYSLSRRTSADMACTSSLRIWWPHIHDNHRKMILETIESEKDLVGQDPFLWDSFLKDMKSEKK